MMKKRTREKHIATTISSNPAPIFWSFDISVLRSEFLKINLSKIRNGGNMVILLMAAFIVFGGYHNDAHAGIKFEIPINNSISF